jgi:VCBS repeat-containing protein
VGAGQSSGITTVTLTVSAVSVRPVGVADSYATPEDTTLTTAPPGVLGNDVSVGPLTATMVTGPVHGTVALAADGSFSYVPVANFNGTDPFTYTASDGVSTTEPVLVSLTVSPVNDRPVAAARAFSMTEDASLTVPAPGLLGNDPDPDGGTLTTALATESAHGTATVGTDGSFSYVPFAHFNGTDSFTYTASDGILASTPSTVTITVAAVNDAPVTTTSSYTLDEDSPLTVPAPGVLRSAVDIEGDPLTAARVSEPSHGNLAFNVDGSFTYTPVANFNGADSFTFTAYDGTGTSAVTTVVLTVNPVADVPVTVPGDDLAVGADNSDGVSIDLGSLIDNPDGGPLTLISVTNGAFGTVTCVANACTYVPNGTYAGTDEYTYTFRTADGTLITGTVRVNVTPTGAEPPAEVPVPVTVTTPVPGPGLPVTGLALGGLLLAALGLVGTGAAALVGTRRRRRSV